MQHYFKGVLAMSRAYLLMTLRSKTALFWTLAFPLFFLLVFGYIFGGGQPERVGFILPGLLVITVISATFFGTSMHMVAQREQGVFRRYRVTPVTPLVIVLAHAAVAFFNLTISLTLQILGAKLLFGVKLAGSIPAMTVSLFLGFFAFVPLGLIIGSVARDMKTAPAITNLLFFPMMFLSGAAVPFFMLPEWIQTLGSFLPATYLVEALQGVMVKGQALLQTASPLAVLGLTGVVAFSLNSLLFRWESEEPVNMRNLGLAAGGLAVVYLLAALFGAEFKMSKKPGGFNDKAQTTPPSEEYYARSLPELPGSACLMAGQPSRRGTTGS